MPPQNKQTKQTKNHSISKPSKQATNQKPFSCSRPSCRTVVEKVNHRKQWRLCNSMSVSLADIFLTKIKIQQHQPMTGLAVWPFCPNPVTDRTRSRVRLAVVSPRHAALSTDFRLTKTPSPEQQWRWTTRPWSLRLT